MQPTREQFYVLKAMARRMGARLNAEYRVVGDRDQYTTRKSVVDSMVEAGYLTHVIHRTEAGERAEEWHLTALGLGTYVHIREARRAAARAARHSDAARCAASRERMEILAILCSSPSAVILPNGSFRGASPVPGIDRPLVLTKTKLAMFQDGLLERVAGAYRLPIFRVSVKGIEAHAEFLNAVEPHKAALCICGQGKREHPACGHVFTDARDVAVLDYINAKLKERDHAV